MIGGVVRLMSLVEIDMGPKQEKPNEVLKTIWGRGSFGVPAVGGHEEAGLG